MPKEWVIVIHTHTKHNINIKSLCLEILVWGLLLSINCQ